MKKRSIYETNKEQDARNFAAWLSKLSRSLRFTVRKRRLKSGAMWQINMRYKPNTNPVTFIKIGFALSTLAEGRVININKRAPNEAATIDPRALTLTAEQLQNLPFN